MPKLIVSVAAPLSVREGDAYDYLVAVSNPTDGPLPGGATVNVYLPDGAEFIAGDQGNVVGPYSSNGYQTVSFPNVDASGQALPLLPHASLLHRVSVRAPQGSRGKVFKCADVNTLVTGAIVVGSHQVLTPVPAVHSGELVTFVYPDDQPFGNAKAQILDAALAGQGLSVAELANRADYQAKIDALDAHALGVRSSGGDCITFSNTAVLVPLLGNQVLSGGGVNSITVRDQDKAAHMAGGGGTLISQDGSRLISQNGSGLVAAGAGNLVAAGAGN